MTTTTQAVAEADWAAFVNERVEICLQEEYLQENAHS